MMSFWLWILFIFSLQDISGDNRLVNIIEKWEILEEYAGEKLGFYQLRENGETTEIRVQTGRVGFKKEFESETDELLIRILNFCQRHGYIKVCQTTRDEDFFK
jgi:hypothetical protein